MRNHEVTTVQPLLNKDGSLREPGWSRKPVQIYDRNLVKASKFRIKEWDYYIVLAEDFGIALTVSDIGYIGLQSVTLFDFTKPKEITNTIIKPLTLGKLRLPTSSQGNVHYHDKKLDIDHIVSPGNRNIKCEFREFALGKTLTCDINLEQPDADSMVIATPWSEKKTAFYYNQKINCMRASGKVNFAGKEYVFNPETDFGTLDWGRGVWTYENTWYWGSGNGIVEGKPFGFNIGYGFGNTAAATENILFYDGVAHKLDDITFNIPKDSYTKPWTFSSSDKRFEMDFIPVIDRAAKTSLGIIVTDQHQVFGKMSGKAVLDDGKVLEIKDLLCFAEDVHNKY
ncbi:MAG: DUF2804 domain-containing protein [Clostridiales bacterium]|nr:DUF2804 domain-containing protein [Clostridiales bacterium]